MNFLELSWGTFGGRWFVTAFAVAYVFLGRRLLGWKRLGVYTAVAFPVAVLAENASVNWGIPFTHYEFNAALRGEELWILDVPLFVPLSYTFVMFFAWSAGRFAVSGPWRSAPRNRLVAYAIGVLFATWSTWSLDPVTQIGDLWYIGETFSYQGPGFWFGLPLGSQVGWFVVSALLCGALTALTRNESCERVVVVRHHPLLLPSVVFLIEVVHVSIVAVVVGAHTLGGSGLIVWLPVVAVSVAIWSQQPRPQSPGGGAVESASRERQSREGQSGDGSSLARATSESLVAKG